MLWHLCNYKYCDNITHEESEWVGAVDSPADGDEVHVRVSACSQGHLTSAMTDAAESITKHNDALEAEADEELAGDVVFRCIILDAEGRGIRSATFSADGMRLAGQPFGFTGVAAEGIAGVRIVLEEPEA